MNGRENSTSLALFFALVSIGAIIKGDELIGIGVGAVFAIISAFFLKQSILQAAVTEEDNHQRLEIQFQQLRNKIHDSSNESTILCINNNAKMLQGSLQNILEKLSELENLSQAAQATVQSETEIQAALASVAETTKTSKDLMSEIVNNSESQAKLLKVSVEKMSDLNEKLSTLAENSKKANDMMEAGQTTVQTGLKLMQVIGQMLKSPPFAKDITALNDSMKTLSEKLSALDKLNKLDKLDVFDEINTSIKGMSTEMAGLSELKNAVLDSSKATTTVVENLTEINKGISGEMSNINETLPNVITGVEKSTADITAAIVAMREDISKLTTKMDAYNGLMKAALEQYSTLSEQDVKVLEKIAEKIQ